MTSLITTWLSGLYAKVAGFTHEDGFDHAAGSLVSYLVAALTTKFGSISQEDIMFFLGASLALVRLAYDTVRFVRYLRNPDRKIPKD